MKLWIVLLLLTATLIPVQAQGYRTLTATIDTQTRTRTVEIRYYPGSEEWAEDVINTIRTGFPLLEEKIGVPSPIPWDIIVEETHTLEKGVAAVNRGKKGLLVPSDTPMHVIIHELCHYWFGWQTYSEWSNWIQEGFPEAYTISVLKELNHPDGLNHWYARLDQYEWAKARIGDQPLSKVGYAPDFTDPRVSMLYSKSMVFCTWFILFVGEESMHQINENVISKAILTGEDYQSTAEAVTGKDLDWLFSGWVYPGDYLYEERSVSFEWFAGDGDKDGIETFEEIRTGSNPFIADTDRDGLPDGYELLLKTDPKKADTDNDGLKDGEEVPINIDGENTEWKTPLIEDEKDSENADIKAVYYAADEKFLYFMVEFYTPSTNTYHSGISIDVNDDENADFIFFVLYDHLFLSIWEDGKWVETISNPALLKGAFAIKDQVVEFRIPKRMRQAHFQKTINVWAYEYSAAEEEVIDETYYVSVSVDKTVEGTNPLNPDSDKEIPEEPQTVPSGTPEEKAPQSEPPPLSVPPEEKSENLPKIMVIVVIILLCSAVGSFLLRRAAPREKICPICGHVNKGGDFCEKCGAFLS